MTGSRQANYTIVPKAKLKKKLTVNSYPRELRGLSQNRYGGHQSQNMRTYGGKRGAAGPVKILSPDERKAVEDDLRQRGLI